jgi:hypothetical protein
MSEKVRTVWEGRAVEVPIGALARYEAALEELSRAAVVMHAEARPVPDLGHPGGHTRGPTASAFGAPWGQLRTTSPL